MLRKLLGSFISWVGFLNLFCPGLNQTLIYINFGIKPDAICFGYEDFEFLIWCSDALRTRETLKIMQEQVRDFLEAEVRYVSSFYSIAAMDGQTAEHLQRIICRYSADDIVTVM